MTVAWFLLSFVLYVAANDDMGEHGFVVARSCAQAEAHMRAGLREGQSVEFGTCEPYQAETASR